MATYLVISNDTETKSYKCKDTHTGDPYLKVSNGQYLDLTTNTTTGLRLEVKKSNSTYLPMQTTTTTATRSSEYSTITDIEIEVNAYSINQTYVVDYTSRHAWNNRYGSTTSTSLAYSGHRNDYTYFTRYSGDLYSSLTNNTTYSKLDENNYTERASLSYTYDLSSTVSDSKSTISNSANIRSEHSFGNPIIYSSGYYRTLYNSLCMYENRTISYNSKKSYATHISERTAWLTRRNQSYGASNSNDKSLNSITYSMTQKISSSTYSVNYSYSLILITSKTYDIEKITTTPTYYWKTTSYELYLIDNYTDTIFGTNSNLSTNIAASKTTTIYSKTSINTTRSSEYETVTEILI